MNPIMQVPCSDISCKDLSETPVIKNKILLSPGFWKGNLYTPEEIRRAYQNTDWDDKDVVSILADHNDDDETGRVLSIHDWLGYVENPHLDSSGALLGDLRLYDKNLATKLLLAKVKFGVSARVDYGSNDNIINDEVRNFKFRNFSVVVNPACKDAFINLSEENQVIERLEDISAFERIRKKSGMGIGEFYAVPRNPPSASKLPIFDAAHTRNAMARFNQTQFLGSEEKSKAKGKILSAARKFDIEVKEFDKLEETSTSDVHGKEIDSKGLQPINYKKKKKKVGPGGHTPDATGPHGAGAGPGKGKADGTGLKKKSNSTEVKGGKNEKMAEEIEEKQNGKEIEEDSENVEVKQEETSKEENSETEETNEEKTKEEPKEVSEENLSKLSEDSILTKIANLSLEFQKRKEITPEESRLKKIEENISKLSEDVKKLSIKLQEEDEEENEETKSKKLSEDNKEVKSVAKSIPKMEEENGFFTLSGKKPSAGNEEFAAMLKR